MTKNKTRIIVGNKIDLGKNVDLDLEKMINVSALTSAGIDQLETEVKRLFVDESVFGGQAAFLSNARHIGKVGEAKTAIGEAIAACQNRLPIDMIEIDIRKAWENLGEITGERGSETLIRSLFSKFCLGK